MTGAEYRRAFSEHKDAVYRFAWRMTGSAGASEDIVQEVFLALLRQPARFDAARGGMRSFLLGIARNVALKRWREEHRWAALDDEQFIAEPTDLVQGERAASVGAAVQELPPLQREVLVMAEYEGMTLEEIARAVEAEVGTVKGRLHRARENLRRMLAPLKSKSGRSVESHGTSR
jgi:RNA polymerase sigma-70 factor (ECF subfamily)